MSSMQLNTPPDVLITGSWDRTLRFWDPRSASPQQLSRELPERVYHMDITKNTLAVAMASRMFYIYDIMKMDTPAQQRESSLQFLTRSLACMVRKMKDTSSICRFTCILCCQNSRNLNYIFAFVILHGF
jgi:cell cycle arrest protein BUB3